MDGNFCDVLLIMQDFTLSLVRVDVEATWGIRIKISWCTKFLNWSVNLWFQIH